MDIELRNISKGYGEKQVLKDFSADFPEGTLTAVMAPSGSGKTTLLRLILGLEAPDSGEIIGVPEEMSVLFQEDRLLPEHSVMTNLRFALGRQTGKREILEMLRELGLEDCAGQSASELSGGMARRVALARALLYPARLLVLDEPFNGLDSENRRLAAEAILRRRKNRTVLVVTHRQEDLELLKADRRISL